MSSSPTDGPSAGASLASAAATADVTMPQMGVSASEGTLVAWCKQVGDWVEADETICEISTDKIDADVPAPAAGRVSEILVGVEETVAVGTVLARIATDAIPGEAHAAEHLEPAGQAPPSRPPSYSPVVRRIAAEHGIDLASVVGTGRSGRVRKQDVLAVVQAAEAAETDAPDQTDPPQPPLHIESPYRPDPDPAPPPAPAPEGERSHPERLSRMRRAIGERMVESLRTAAQCTTIAEVDMSRVEEARARNATTYLPWVARAAVVALREFPILNSTLDGDVLTRHDDVNLGIAVSLGDDGLIVAVVHGAHELSVEGLAARIAELSRRAREGALGADDVANATFTITNPGAFGAIAATPIINPPQVAILDLEAVVKRCVVVTDAAGGDAVAIRPMANLCLSWDHRALDGALAACFLAALRRNLEHGGEE